MTREEIIQGLYRGDSRAIKEAIKALEQQPCEDTISRQAAIDATWFEPSYTDPLNVLTEVRDRLKALPPVTPKQKTGHWIEIAQYSDGKHKIECSECKGLIFSRGHANSHKVKNEYKYCPHCGKRMIEPQESEDKE